MSIKPRILALSGCPRGDSPINRLLQAAAEGAAEAGAEVTTVHLADLSLPLFDADWENEHGIPDSARLLRTFLSENHGLLIGTPEHSGSYSALLKNAVDWASHVADDFEDDGVSVFAGRAAVIVATSTEPPGGAQAQVALQLTLTALGALVIPASLTVDLRSAAGEATTGSMAAAHRLGAGLSAVAARLIPDGNPVWQVD